MRKIRCADGPINATINIPGSKSISHRVILLAALADGVSEISNLRICSETKTFIRALHQLGIVAQLDEKNRSCIIAGGNGLFPRKEARIKCGSSKTVTRFLVTACAAMLGVYYFDGAKPLRQLPMIDFLNVLCRQGAQLIPSDITHIPLTLVGADSFEGGELILEGGITDQIASAMLMISPFARSAFHFNVINLANSFYVDMTCAVMAEFGVLVHRIHQAQYMVPVPQRYQARDYLVEPDFNLASYFFAAAALTTGEITIPITKRASSKQPDVKFIAILEKMGCVLTETTQQLTVKGPKKLKGVDVSLRDFSNCFSILAVMAPFADAPTRITHVGKANKKDLDRLKQIRNQLLKMNIRVESGDDWLQIYPGHPEGCQIPTFSDHKIAMAFSLMGLKIPDIIIENSNCVNKVFPEFYALWDGLVAGEVNEPLLIT